MSTHAIIVFSDIRGFTKAVEAVKFSNVAAEFMSEFHKFADLFPGDMFKPNGDGFLKIIPTSPEDADSTLEAILGSISSIDSEFRSLRDRIGKRIALRLDFQLGWGIARGDVFDVIPREWVGGDINMAARLCDCARPWGVVISADAFPDAPSTLVDGAWHKDIRKLNGIGDTAVWESATAHSQFVPRELRRDSPEVHVAGTCWRMSARGVEVLLSRRNRDRELFKEKWEGCGGQLQHNEDFHTGVARHFRTELGIGVAPDKDHYRHYVIAEPNHPVIPGVRFICRHVEGEPASPNHAAHKWVTVPELAGMDAGLFPPGLKDQVMSLLEECGLTQ